MNQATPINCSDTCVARRYTRGRSFSSGALRSRWCTVVLAWMCLALAGCGPGYRDRDRWPVCALPQASSRDDVAWLSPTDQRSVMIGDSPVATATSWLAAICPLPDAEGFLVFGDGDAQALTRESGDWRTRSLGDMPSRVRAAVAVPSGAAVIITGGETQPPPRQTDAADEPLPWLMGGEARVATVADDRILVGEPDVQTDWNPWRLKTGHFAGEDNVLVFVYKRTPFDAVARQRPFIYRVATSDDGTLHLQARWRGTSFSHPFVDATFGDFTGSGDGEIAALEAAGDGGRLLTAYHFEGFGLEGLAPSVELPEVDDYLAAADLVGDARDELIVYVEGGDGPFAALDSGPRFVVYALTSGPDPKLVPVASASAMADLLSWVPVPRTPDRSGSVIYISRETGSVHEAIF